MFDCSVESRFATTALNYFAETPYHRLIWLTILSKQIDYCDLVT